MYITRIICNIKYYIYKRDNIVKVYNANIKEVIKEYLNVLGIKQLELLDYEADDIVGSMAKLASKAGYDSQVISGDKDLLQLISDEVDVKLLKQSGHILMTREEFMNTYQVEPIRMIDLKALMGDSSDHIPGVKGIGEKTASAIVSTAVKIWEEK